MEKLICNAPWGKAKPSNFARVVTRLAGMLAISLAAALPAVAETYTWNGGVSGSLSTAANWSPAPGGAFTASDELVIGSPARITVDSATTVSKITVTTARNVSFLPSGSGALTVMRIANTSTGVTQFFCPVQFTGTYYVEQTGAVRFPGGATAAYPDAALRTSSSSDIARTLDGIFTFTADWNVPNIGDGNHPWRIAPGTEVRGRVFTGSESGTSRILYIADGGYACFTTVAIGNGCGEIGIDGFLEATTEITVGSKGGSATLGSGGKTGTVKAPCIRKVGGYYFYCNTPNIYVGAGGIGADHKDYTFYFTGDATITATANFDFLGVYNSGNPSDWCFNLNGKTVTINIPEGLTATLGVTVTGSGVIRKAGEDDACEPVTAYGKGKLAVERLFIDAGFDVKIARCFAFTGPHLNRGIHFAIGNFIQNCLDGKPIIINGDGTPLRSYLYADDLVEWLFAILERGENGRPYNVGSDRAVSIRELAETVRDALGSKSEIIVKGMPKAGEKPSVYVPSIERARVELGLDVKVALENAIRFSVGCTARKS